MLIKKPEICLECGNEMILEEEEEVIAVIEDYATGVFCGDECMNKWADRDSTESQAVAYVN